MKKIVSLGLALMCVATMGWAEGNSYQDKIAKKLDKIMGSDVSLNEKFEVLGEKVDKLLKKAKLSEKQKAELVKIYETLARTCANILHKYPKAAEYYSKLLELKESAAIYFERGKALYKSKDYAGATADLLKAEKLGLPVGKEELYWLRGCAEYLAGNYGGAEKDLKKLLEIDVSKWDRAVQYLADALQKQGKYEEALSWLNRLCLELKTKEFSLKKMADIYCSTGQFEECQAIINELEENFPLSDALCLLKSQLSYAMGNFEETTAQLDKEFAKDFRKTAYDYELFIMRSQIALAQGNYQEALNFVDQAVREPLPPYSNKLRGDIYLAMGEKTKALDFYYKFMKENKNVLLMEHVQQQVIVLEEELQQEREAQLLREREEKGEEADGQNNSYN